VVHALATPQPPAPRWTRSGDSTAPQLDGGEILRFSNVFSWARRSAWIFNSNEPSLARLRLTAQTQIAS
jgi:hypothetical protein